MLDLDALMNLVVSEFRNRRVVIPLPHDEVERIRTTRNISDGDFFDLFARRVAHEYEAGRLVFEVADVAMNSLYGYVTNHYDVILPSYALEVFVAFDDGEHHHHDDPAGTDPEEKYTKPQIHSIVVRDRILGTTGESAS